MPQDPHQLRRHERFKGKLPITFDYVGARRKGIALNFSASGLFIQSETLPEVGSEIKIFCELGKFGPVPLEGKVVWTRQGNYISSSETESRGFGFDFTEINKTYVTFVQKFKEFVESRKRQDSRIDVNHKISFKSGYEFLTEYCENLSKSGLYLNTSKDLKKDQVINLILEVPGIEKPLLLEGKVVHSLSEKEAVERGYNAGVGVQFVNLSPEATSHLENFIKRLQIHRHSRARRQTGPLPHRGKLQDYLVPEILISLFESQATGQLHIDVKGIRKTVFLKNGRPVYVSSPLRNESFGYHLLRMGVIEEETMREVSEEMTKHDFKFGEALLEKRYIDPATLAQFLVSHQEEKLASTFQYFNGTYDFQTQEQWPSGISFFPLRLFHVLFSGANHWFNEAIIQAWTGLDAATMIKLQQGIPNHTEMPPSCLRMLHVLRNPKTIQSLSEELRIPYDNMYPILFIFFLAGWIEITTNAVKQEPSLEKSLEELNAEKLMIEGLTKAIEQDYQKISTLDFFKLFDITLSDSIYGIDGKYYKWLDTYQNEKLLKLKNNELMEKAALISTTIKIAYDTIKDPYLRQLYVRRSAGTNRKNREEYLQTDLIYMQCVQMLEQKKMDDILKILQGHEKLLKNDGSLLGLYVWVLFQKNSGENLKDNLEKMDLAVTRSPADAQLRFFRGKMYEHMNISELALADYEKALELQPNFMKAEAARDQALQRQQITKITSMKKKK